MGYFNCKAMLKIYSKVEPELLLAIVNLLNEIKGREDLTNPCEILQVARIFEDKKFYRPHAHLPKKVEYLGVTQESMVVIKGWLRCYIYDLDDSIISIRELTPGDCIINFAGGHAYEVMESNTFFYEFKSGPYYGQEQDKVFID